MQNETSFIPKQALRAIIILFYTMMIGMTMFGLIVYILNFFQAPPITDKEVVRILFIAVLFMSAVCLSAATALYKKRILAAQDIGLSLIEKLNIYRASLVVYLSLCEGAGLFAVIIYFLTGAKLLIAVFILIVLAMLLKRPEKLKIFNDLQLSSQEQLELN